jgi:WD40 repeat protein
MDEEKNEGSSQYTWNGVIEFLVGQVKTNQKKEAEWQLEKQELVQRLAIMDGQLLSHKTLNEDLMRRVKMLEFALRQERKEAGAAQYKGGEPATLKSSVSRQFPEETSNMYSESQIEERLAVLESFPKRQTQSHTELLERLMKEIDCEDIYAKVIEADQHFKNTSDSLLAILPPPGVSPSQNASFYSSESSLLGKLAVSEHEIPTLKSPDLPQTKREVPANFERSKRMPKPISLDVSGTIRAHLDAVRDMYYSENYQFLITTGEDSVTKIFDLASVMESNSTDDLVDSLTVFRESQASLLTIAGSVDPSSPLKSELIFAAGLEGLLQVWQLRQNSNGLPLVTSLTSPHDDSMVLHQDVIWSIQSHPTEPWLITSGADGLINHWTYEVDAESFEFKITNAERPGTFNLGSKGQCPTVLSWLPSKKEMFLAGVRDSDKVRLYSLGKEAQVAELSGMHSPKSQFDSIVPHVAGNTFWGGDESGTVCLFDLRSKKVASKKKLSPSPIGSMTLSLDERLLFVGCHNGILKVMDSSKLEEVASLKLHNCKYDEGIHKVLNLAQHGRVLTGGADGLVRMLSI